MTAPRALPGGTARWLVGALVVLGLVLAAVAARSGPSHPFTRTTPPPLGRSITPPSATTAPPPSRLETSDRPHDKGHFDWLGVLFGLVLLLLIVLTLWGRKLGRLVRRGAREPATPTGLDGLAMPPEDLVPEQLGDALDEGLVVIERGPVSEAIIECWLRVETAAEDAGLPVRASETSTEFTDRVLSAYGVGADVLRRMSALYREARFSSHPMGERGRDDARACLRRISDDLARATTPAPADDPAVEGTST